MPVPSTILDLSSTAASNSPAGSDPISTNLDDYLRGIQAILRAESLNKGWERYNHTITWLSTTSFTVPTDLTALYRVGRRLKSTLAGPTTAYHTITASSFGGGVTTVTVANDSTVLSSPISEMQLGVDVLAFLTNGEKLFDGAKATTQGTSDSSEKLATTAFVQALLALRVPNGSQIGYGRVFNDTRTDISMPPATQFPVDGTLPLITEGTDCGLSLAHSAASTTNKLLVRATIQFATSSLNRAHFALFAGNTCIGVGLSTNLNSASGTPSFVINEAHTVVIEAEHTPGVTTSVTYTVRVSSHNTGSLYLNQDTDGNNFGAVHGSSITIQEIKAS